MRLDAKNKVKIAFKNKGIMLHIDDGIGYCKGGGGPIKFDSKFESPDPFSEEWDWYYYSKYGLGFNQIRVGIFHYCIIAHKDEDNPDKIGGWGGSYTHQTSYQDSFVFFNAHCGQ